MIRVHPRLFVLFLFLASMNAQATVLIHDVTVIDPLSGALPHQDVLLEDNRIVSVAAHDPDTPGKMQASLRNRGESADETQIVSGQGRFLIPGLWDAHVHMQFDPSLAAVMPRLLLAHGITQVRDTGAPLEAALRWRSWAAENPQLAPRIFVAGPLLDGARRVYDGSAPGYPDMSLAVVDAASAVATVDHLADQGVDLIKAYEMLEPETFKAIVRRARERGLPVTGHIPLGMRTGAASTAGLSSIEHLRNVELDCSENPEHWANENTALLESAGDTPGRTLRSRAHALHRSPASLSIDWATCHQLLEQLKANETRQVPTLTLLETVYDARHTSPRWRSTFDLLPVASAAAWRANSQRMSTLFDDDPEGAAGRSAYMNWARTTVAYLADSGMLMAGTDSPIFFMTPGISLHEELRRLVANGLSTEQALQSATITPARYFGLEHELGRVKPGWSANLLLLNANPLSDISNTTRIEAVVRAGKYLNRDQLDGLLRAARSGTASKPPGLPN